jgi:hypothetical protein
VALVLFSPAMHERAVASRHPAPAHLPNVCAMSVRFVTTPPFGIYGSALSGGLQYQTEGRVSRERESNPHIGCLFSEYSGHVLLIIAVALAVASGRSRHAALSTSLLSMPRPFRSLYTLRGSRDSLWLKLTGLKCEQHPLSGCTGPACMHAFHAVSA